MDACFQAVERLIETGFGAGEEDVFREPPLRPPHFARLAEVILHERAVAEIKGTAVILRLWRIELAIEVLGHLGQCPMRGRAEPDPAAGVPLVEQSMEVRGV